MLPVTSLAAVALAALFVVLTLNVVRNRGRERVAVGTGSETLARAIRAHGNFCETVPLTLILLGLAEGGGASGLLLAVVAAAFVIGRIAHAYSLTTAEPRGSMLFRMIGMGLTFTPITVLAAALLVLLALA